MLQDTSFFVVPAAKGVRKRRCNSLILRLFAFVCVCSRLRAFICILGPLSESLKFAFVCVCVRLRAFVRVCKHPLLLHPLLQHPDICCKNIRNSTARLSSWRVLMEPFVVTLQGPLVPMSPKFGSLFFPIFCFSLLFTATKHYSLLLSAINCYKLLLSAINCNSSYQENPN